MADSSVTNAKIKPGDRVRRVYKTEVVQRSGCFGTVKDVRHEVTANTSEQKERGLLLQVQWDNGTFSYHGMEGIVPAE